MEPLNPGCFASGIMGQKNPGGVLNVTIFAIAQPLLIEANIFVITTHRPGAIMQDHTLPPKKFCRPAWLSGHRKCCSALWRWVFSPSCRRVPPAWIHSASGSVGISAAHDFLDALVARGFLKRESGSYRNMPETSLFLIGISHPI